MFPCTFKTQYHITQEIPTIDVLFQLVGWSIRSRFPPFNNQQVDYSINLPNWAPLFFLKDETYRTYRLPKMAIIFGKDGNSTGPSMYRLYNLYMIMILILMVLCRTYYSWIIYTILYNQQFIVTEVPHFGVSPSFQWDRHPFFPRLDIHHELFPWRCRPAFVPSRDCGSTGRSFIHAEVIPGWWVNIVELYYLIFLGDCDHMFAVKSPPSILEASVWVCQFRRFRKELRLLSSELGAQCLGLLMVLSL